MTVVGITGTNGKTTTTYLLRAVFEEAGRPAEVLGTLSGARTTPEAPELQARLAAMRDRGVQAVAMEVSSHALAMHRVDGTHFAVAVFTNLSRDHLDFHLTLEDYYRAKASLFTPERTRAGVVDVDDEHGRRLVGDARVPLTTCSALGGEADWRAVDVRTRADGSSFVVLGPAGERAPVEVRLPGDFNVSNALCAVVGLVVAGVPLHSAVAGVGALTGVPGRMEPVDAGQPYLAVVDYAHTPDAVAMLLRAVRALVPGRVVVVLGCGGDRDPDKRPMMGAEAVRGSDLAVLTTDNPRSEDPAAILDAMLAGALEAEPGATGRLVVEPDRVAAIARAVAAVGPGDAVVVAGKGHETGQEAGGVVVPFDDRVELRRAILAAVVR
jgi:UDP-N-acetylmuramoyl-L-alanyl-D-glutamate--2,6-diaminopimelate ligase